jgi:hypothetical protein
MLCLLLVGPVLTGWVVGRLHRAHGIAMVIVFAAFIALLSTAVTIRTVLLTSAWTPLNVIRVAVEIALLNVVPTTVIAGGFWSTRPIQVDP